MRAADVFPLRLAVLLALSQGAADTGLLASRVSAWGLEARSLSLTMTAQRLTASGGLVERWEPQHDDRRPQGGTPSLWWRLTDEGRLYVATVVAAWLRVLAYEESNPPAP